MLWSDKYNPKHIKDIVLNDNVKKKINGYIQQRTFPNLIVSGTTGIGKSILVDCLAREYYQKDYEKYVLKLNSSIDKNIKILQEILEFFCKKTIVEFDQEKKMVIIDDIDHIPTKLQSIIAFTMDKYQNVYFALTCNDLSQIIDTIQTRCMLMHLHRPEREKIINHYQLICKNMNCQYNFKALEYLYLITQGDIRLAINTLQIIYVGYQNITTENINKVCDVPNIITLQKILILCFENNTKKALEQSLILYNSGYTCSDILSGFYDIIKTLNLNIDEEIKIKYASIIGKFRYAINKNIDSCIQLERCIIKLCSINNSMR
jgi:DNA polymerase III delta prime subunit